MTPPRVTGCSRAAAHRLLILPCRGPAGSTASAVTTSGNGGLRPRGRSAPSRRPGAPTSSGPSSKSLRKAEQRGWVRAVRLVQPTSSIRIFFAVQRNLECQEIGRERCRDKECHYV